MTCKFAIECKKTRQDILKMLVFDCGQPIILLRCGCQHDIAARFACLINSDGDKPVTFLNTVEK